MFWRAGQGRAGHGHMAGVNSWEGGYPVVPAVTQSEVVGGRGWPIHNSGGRASPQLQVKVESEWGRPVKGRDGIVGWMRSPVPVEKVSDIVVVISLS